MYFFTSNLFISFFVKLFSCFSVSGQETWPGTGLALPSTCCTGHCETRWDGLGHDTAVWDELRQPTFLRIILISLGLMGSTSRMDSYRTLVFWGFGRWYRSAVALWATLPFEPKDGGVASLLPMDTRDLTSRPLSLWSLGFSDLYAMDICKLEIENILSLQTSWIYNKYMNILIWKAEGELWPVLNILKHFFRMALTGKTSPLWLTF